MTAKAIGIYIEKPPERPYGQLGLSAFLIQELDRLYDRANTLDRYFNFRLAQKSDIDMEVGLVILTDQNFALFFALNQGRSVFSTTSMSAFCFISPSLANCGRAFAGSG